MPARSSEGPLSPLMWSVLRPVGASTERDSVQSGVPNVDRLVSMPPTIHPARLLQKGCTVAR